MPHQRCLRECDSIEEKKGNCDCDYFAAKHNYHHIRLWAVATISYMADMPTLLILAVCLLVLAIGDGSSPVGVNDMEKSKPEPSGPSTDRLPLMQSRQKGTVSTITVRNRNEKKLGPGMTSKDLLWKPNPSGFYNHFFELKYVLPFARNNSRRVFVESVKSEHYDREESLCNTLEIYSLHCLRGHLRRSDCSLTFQAHIHKIVQNASDICFSGGCFHRLQLHRQRYYIYLEPFPRLLFKSQYQRLFRSLRQHLLAQPIPPYKPELYGIINSTGYSYNASWVEERYQQHSMGVRQVPSLSDRDFIVIHWRRGDQLSTRCDQSFAGYKDTSVNCANVTEFLQYLHIERLRFPAKSTRFLIATNERQPDVLNLLRLHGYHLLTDLLRSFVYQRYRIVSPFKGLNSTSSLSNTENSPGKQHRRLAHDDSFGTTLGALRKNAPSSKPNTALNFWNAAQPPAFLSAMDELVIESIFMLEARVLINFGISSLHDALESERMLRHLDLQRLHVNNSKNSNGIGSLANQQTSSSNKSHLRRRRMAQQASNHVSVDPPDEEMASSHQDVSFCYMAQSEFSWCHAYHLSPHHPLSSLQQRNPREFDTLLRLTNAATASPTLGILRDPKEMAGSDKSFPKDVYNLMPHFPN